MALKFLYLDFELVLRRPIETTPVTGHVAPWHAKFLITPALSDEQVELQRPSVANLVFTLHQAACIGTRCDVAKLDVVRQWTK